MNRAEEDAISTSGGITVFKFLWRFQMRDRHDGTSVLSPEQQQGPALSAAGPDQTAAEANHEQHITTALPKIRLTKKTKRLIDDGQHEATAVRGYHHWNNQYGRWEAIVEFVFEAPIPAGPPLLMRVNMGQGSDPEISADHWFGRILEKFGTTDVSKLAGWRFLVTVGTVKKPHGDKHDLPQAEWYSTVRRAVLWDDHVRACK